MRALKVGRATKAQLVVVRFGSNDVLSTGPNDSLIQVLRPHSDPFELRCPLHVFPSLCTMASASRSVTMASSSIMGMLRPRMMQASSTRFSPLQAQIRQLTMRPTRALRRTHVSLNCTYTYNKELLSNVKFIGG